MDGPHQGSRPQSTTWTDPTRVINLNNSTKWTNTTEGQDHSPQSGRTPRRVKTTVHKVDGPNQGHKLKQVHKVDGHHRGSKPVHKVDGPHGGSRPLSTKWTDPTRVNNKRLRTHKVDGSHKGLRTQLTKLMKSTKCRNPIP